jgi:uncharacterized protein (TIGR02147 family)
MDQYEFYSKWYHVAVRSLIGMYEFKSDYAWLARQVQPHLTPKQARQSVKLLLKLGLITRYKNGVFDITEKSITTGEEVTNLALQNFHVECSGLAAKAIGDLPRNKRNITGLTLGISENCYLRICEEINEFQKKIMLMADRDGNADRVYRFNFHLFPISKT